MPTKKELIAIAEDRDIRFKKSWSKAQIQAAIEEGVKNSDPIWIECKFSKIKFDAVSLGVSERTEVHPEIADWKQSANRNDWYSGFFAAIDYGISQGFTTIKEFELILERAQADKPLDGSEPEEIKSNLQLSGTGYKFNKNCGGSRKPWIAKIVGLSEKYDYQREFQDPVEIDDSSSRAGYKFLITEEGYYQRKEYSGSGNAYVAWYKFENDKFIEIEEKDIIAIFGNPADIKAEKEKINSQITKKFLNPNWSKAVGETVKTSEGQFTVLKIESEDVDIDGIPCKYIDSSGYFATDITYFCRKEGKQ